MGNDPLLFGCILAHGVGSLLRDCAKWPFWTALGPSNALGNLRPRKQKVGARGRTKENGPEKKL